MSRRAQTALISVFAFVRVRITGGVTPSTTRGCVTLLIVVAQLLVKQQLAGTTELLAAHSQLRQRANWVEGQLEDSREHAAAEKRAREAAEQARLDAEIRAREFEAASGSHTASLV